MIKSLSLRLSILMRCLLFLTRSSYANQFIIRMKQFPYRSLRLILPKNVAFKDVVNSLWVYNRGATERFTAPSALVYKLFCLFE